MGWPALVSKAQTHLYTASSFITFTKINLRSLRKQQRCIFFPLYDNQIKCFSGDCSSPSATSQIGLVLCPSHTSPGAWAVESTGTLARWWPAVPQIQRCGAAREEASPSLGGSPGLTGGVRAQMLWPRGLGRYSWCPAWAPLLTQGCVLSSNWRGLRSSLHGTQILKTNPKEKWKGTSEKQ